MGPDEVGISPRISCWKEERDPSRRDLVFLKEIPHNSNNYQTSPGWAVSSSQHDHIEHISFLLLPFFLISLLGTSDQTRLGASVVGTGGVLLSLWLHRSGELPVP